MQSSLLGGVWVVIAISSLNKCFSFYGNDTMMFETAWFRNNSESFKWSDKLTNQSSSVANLDVKTFRFAGRLPKPRYVDVVEIKVSKLGRKLFPAPNNFWSSSTRVFDYIRIICFAISGTYHAKIVCHFLCLYIQLMAFTLVIKPVQSGIIQKWSAKSRPWNNFWYSYAQTSDTLGQQL